MTAKIQLKPFEFWANVVTIPVELVLLCLGIGLCSWGNLTGRPEVVDIWFPVSAVAAFTLVAGWVALLATLSKRQMRYAIVAAALIVSSWQWGLPSLTSLVHNANFGGLHQRCDPNAVRLGLRHMPGAAGAPRAQSARGQ